MKSLKEWCLENHREDMLNLYLNGRNPVPPEQMGFSAGKRVRWKCSVCGLEWEASPNKMNRKRRGRSACPFCSHERPSYFFNAALMYPEMVFYWDPELNGGKSLEDYTPKSKYVARWKCQQGHIWERSIKEQTRSVERQRRNPSEKMEDMCPYCGNKRVSAHYNLEQYFPDLAKQWCYSKNGALTPRNVTPYNPKKVYWQCSFNPRHIWQDRISNRTLLLRGCPFCAKKFRISYTARTIFYYVNQYLHQKGYSCACEVQAGRYKIDIEVRPDQQDLPPIALEIDGYRHRLPEAVERDRQKDAFLRKKGYRVIRVKEIDGLGEEIRINGDIIAYPVSNQYRYLDRVTETVLMFLAGIQTEVNHTRDHFKIEEFYHHTCREHSLAVQYPKLAEEWSERNSDTPDMVSPGENVKRWWKCPICNREYEASVANRTKNGSNCPYCNHSRVTPENCLAAVFPEIAAQWDKIKNASLSPTDVLPGTDRRVWWKCEKGHSWQASVSARTGPHKTKCPFCYGKAVDAESSLAAKSPELAQYWHPVKNTVSPTEVAPASNRSFWWRCSQGHQWKDSPNNLRKHLPDRVCPYCNHRRVSPEYSLASQNKELAVFWHPEKNAQSPQEVAPYSNKKFWWRCEKGHQWQESISRMQTFGAEKACPYCNDRKVWEGNSLARLAPELAAEWDTQKNLPLTPEKVLPRSSKKVWWRCSKGHTWQTSVAKRYVRKDGCPYCSGRRASAENCFAAVHPELIVQWDQDRNAPLTPYDVTAGSSKRIWWKCEKCGYTWQSTVVGRLKGKGCPVCNRKQIRHGSFAQEHPELVPQWDTLKNGCSPDECAAHSNKKVWWRCEHGHSWQATPDARSRGSGCPVCAAEKRKKKSAP